VSIGDSISGLYGAIGAGLSYIGTDRDFEATAGPLQFDTDTDYENGIGVYTALGLDHGNDWRTELEFSYRDNDARFIPGDNAGFSGFPSGLTGEVQAYSFMLNAIRDFPTGSVVTPFVGGGIGGVRYEADYAASNPGAIGSPLTIAVDDSSTRLAFQGIAGVGVEMAENLNLDLSYRYFTSLKPEFDGLLNGSATTFRTGYVSHSLFAGLRWNFGAAAPAPVAPQYKDCWDGSSVPVSAECPQQIEDPVDAALDPLSFVVYFDYDKSNLTPEAANLISEASSRALENDVDTVVVTGNTDTSGSSAYNQALSARRAETVRQSLIANGIPADAIDMRALGETNLAKPTPDGTREPLNRRSEVTISFE
ncbi:MAG: OmpA family protein, partial [Pseudomonadota bacterium]